MTDIDDDVVRLARDAAAAARKAADEVADAAAVLVDQGRESARQAFEAIKAARDRAAAKLKD